jgi:hypothetical protein
MAQTVKIPADLTKSIRTKVCLNAAQAVLSPHRAAAILNLQIPAAILLI